MLMQPFYAQELESCQLHGETLRCGAASLLAAVPPPEPLPLGDGQERLPQLYDTRALQLWLLKCCQAVSWLAGAGWLAVGTWSCRAGGLGSMWLGLAAGAGGRAQRRGHS